MGTFTTGHITFHACPAHYVRRVVELLQEHGLSDFDDRSRRLSLALGAKCSSGEWWRDGDIIDLAKELCSEAPEVAFTAYEEPFEDKLGTTCTHVPGLGMYKTACDCWGTPMIQQPQILRWLNASATQRDENLGVPWMTAIAAMPAGEVVEADSFPTQWNLRNGHVQVLDGHTSGSDLNFTVMGDGKVVDAALADRGFLRTNRWIPIDEDKTYWRSDVYRSPTD